MSPWGPQVPTSAVYLRLPKLSMGPVVPEAEQQCRVLASWLGSAGTSGKEEPALRSELCLTNPTTQRSFQSQDQVRGWEVKLGQLEE
jgi:hypothetical protein